MDFEGDSSKKTEAVGKQKNPHREISHSTIYLRDVTNLQEKSCAEYFNMEEYQV
jgi:hypothetical protein